MVILRFQLMLVKTRTLSANGDLAMRYAQAVTENSLRAREVVLPLLQPGDNATEWYPHCLSSVLMTRTLAEICPPG